MFRLGNWPLLLNFRVTCSLVPLAMLSPGSFPLSCCVWFLSSHALWPCVLSRPARASSLKQAAKLGASRQVSIKYLLASLQAEEAGHEGTALTEEDQVVLPGMEACALSLTCIQL